VEVDCVKVKNEKHPVVESIVVRSRSQRTLSGLAEMTAHDPGCVKTKKSKRDEE
jgi:hypothetical protein